MLQRNSTTDRVGEHDPPDNHEGAKRAFFTSRFVRNEIGYFQIATSALDRLHHEVAEDALTQAIKDWTPRTALDAGCALGDFSARLAVRFPSATIVAMDFVHEGLTEASKRFPGLLLLRSALPVIPLSDHSLDLVVCMEVLYYLKPNARRAAVAELARVVAANGLILVSTNLDDGSRYFTKSGLIELFLERFKLVSWTPEYCKPYTMLHVAARKVVAAMRRHRHVSVMFWWLIYALCHLQKNVTLARLVYSLSERVFGRFAIGKGVAVFAPRRSSL